MPKVRAALVQQKWAGDKDSMIKNAVAALREAAPGRAGHVPAGAVLRPVLLPGAGPAVVRWAEQVPDGPTVRLMRDLARELGMVLIVPVYEQEQEGVYYNTAAVIDADGTFLGKHRKNHLPHVTGFWEKFYFRPGNLGYPVFDTAVGRIGVYICYERHFPEGWRALGLAGAKIVFNPSATSRGLSEYLWQLEQTAAAVANEYFVGAINRVGVEPLGDDDFYGSSYFADPRGQIIGGTASDSQEEVVVRDLDMDLLEEVRHQWQFYRDRRPDTYGPLTAA